MTTLKAKVQVLKRLHKSPINLSLILLSLIMLNAILMLSQLASEGYDRVGGPNQANHRNKYLTDDFDHGVYASLGNPNRRDGKALMVIGIPTVSRPSGASYIFDTLDSLFAAMSISEQQQVLVIVFLADLDPDAKLNIKSAFLEKYSKNLDTGCLVVVEARQESYPDMSDLQQTYGDDEDRIQWRSKQAVDFALLWSYSHKLGKYFMQLEDDVVSTPGFVPTVQNFIQSQKSKWLCLGFSHLGFIGKLYKSEDLLRLAKFVMVFFDQHPVDFLLGYFNVIMHNGQVVYRKPSLFQHVGVESSLKEKTQKLKDKYFDNSTKELNGDNPPADLFTSMKTFRPYMVHLAYDLSPGYFWGRSPKAGDLIHIIFNESVYLKRVSILTSSTSHKDDFLLSGMLEASPTLLRYNDDTKEPICTDYVYIGAFKDGQLDVNDLDRQVDIPMKCLKMTVLKDQKPWLLVREIAVFVAEQNGKGIEKKGST